MVIVLSIYGFEWQILYSGYYLAAHSLTLFLVAVVLGFVIGEEKKQRWENERMARKLKLAYEELSSSHSQLKAYTEIVEDMNDEMEHLAVTDDLTLLYNYRYFQNCLERMIRQKNTHPIALIMLDIDHFKKVNDGWGHLVGNKVLVRIAEIIRSLVRDNDVVVRYGGEEFAILLPNTGSKGAHMVAERIRETVAGEVFYELDGEELRGTVSQGITIFPEEAADPSVLISNADKAMYCAKKMGRNRVVLFKDIDDKQQSR